MRVTTYIIVYISLFVSFGVAGLSLASPPRKPNLSQFSVLVANSPFTIKPDRSGFVSVTPLERDWMLGSIRPHGEGWSVTLINKKNRKDRVRLIPGFQARGFQLLEVQQDAESYENSKVRVRMGTQVGWIRYDEKLVKVKPISGASARAPVKPSPRPSVAVRPPVPGQSSKAKTAPRVRRVPIPKR